VQQASTQPSSHAFRPDIEGLRAVAVLSVVGFHLGAGSGGFTGVDVFFVISGYLITGIITRELGEGRFSLWRFYERRARRLLPALTVLLLVVSITAGLLLFRSEILGLRKSQLAAVFFSSNIFFWRTSDYFAEPASEQPLLHTWSLGVEEQFYLLFPLLLMAVFAWRRALLRPLLWAVTLSSFVYSVVLVRTSPTAAFYLLPPRAWELGAGALLVVGASSGGRSRRWAPHLALPGLALLAYSFLAVKESDGFPGEHALPAVLGAVLVIAAGPSSLSGRLLGLLPLRWVGRISYSLYLWHWPVIVLYKVSHPGVLHHSERLALAAVSFLAAFLSWRLVETPLRSWPLPRRRHVLAFAVASLALSTATAYAAEPIEHHRPRSAEADRLVAETLNAPDYRGGVCFIASKSHASSFSTDTCLTSHTPRPDYLLLGDSHAADLWEGIQTALPEIELLQATGSGCKPLLPLKGLARCTSVMQKALDGPLRGHSLDTVIVAARWKAFDLARLPQTLALLRAHSRRVVVLGPTTEYTTALPTLVARALVTHNPMLPAENLETGPFSVEPRLRAAVEAAGAIYISQLELLCDHSACRTRTQDGAVIKTDYGHYSRAGALELGEAVRARLISSATDAP
jgi:peptidoglycan/LPS O-acetylase OafA/YrhL